MNEEEIKNLQEENEKLKEIASIKADTVSVSVHQIRTSLSALKWIIKMFLDGDLGKMTPEQEELLKKAYEGNERAISIASEVLLMNKTANILEKKYEFTKVEIITMIENIIFDFSGEAHTKGIEVIFLKPDTTEKYVKADQEKLRVVLQNIIENAIKYSDMHGKVFITLKEIEDMIQVSVKNKGITISKEGTNKIFEKFYRDPAAQKKVSLGSGIGLYTTKKIIETSGGKIWFISEEEEGTTFFFTIPIFK